MPESCKLSPESFLFVVFRERRHKWLDDLHRGVVS